MKRITKSELPNFESNSEKLNRYLESYSKEYPRRKLEIDVNSEEVLKEWDEFNNISFDYKISSQSFTSSFQNEMIDSINQLVKLKKSLTNLELNKINFHFGNDKRNTVIVTKKTLLNAINSILLENLPNRKPLRNHVKGSLTGFLKRSYPVIQRLNQLGFNIYFLAFYLGVDEETLKTGIRDIKKRGVKSK